MNESYAELLVKREKTILSSLTRALCMAVTVICILLWFVTGEFIIMLIAIAAAVFTYFVYIRTDLEYEYLYLDKELTVDKIMSKTRRKRVAKFDLDRMEIIAPAKSHQLDSYRNRTFQVEDYSCRKKDTADRCYIMIYDGRKKIIFEATRDFMKVVQTTSPRKVFLD